MSTEPTSTTPGDSVSLRIEAPASVIYGIVTDIAGMGRLSPECTGGQWLDGATGPAVGARFKGTNKRGFARWSTKNTVVAAEADREFAFQTRDSGTEWRFALKSDGDATVVTESRSAFAPRPFLARAFTTVLLGGMDEHEDELRAGMAATLERLKGVAEGSA